MNYQSAINYGLFVQFVALNWNTSGTTTNLNGRKVLNPQGNPVIAGSSYTVSDTIYSYDLATDLVLKKGIPPGWVTIGVVAKNDANPDDVVIAIRGTSNVWEWIQDAKFLLIPFGRVAGGGLTEDGFTDMYDSFTLTPGNASQPFVPIILPKISPSATVIVVGHSLGAALATLLAFDFSVNTSLKTVLYTLASPRVGDLTFSQHARRIVRHRSAVPHRFRLSCRSGRCAVARPQRVIVERMVRALR